MARDNPGEWLKRRRIAAGYPKQAALASELRITRSSVANWETGQGKPGLAVLPALATKLGVTQTELAERFGIQTSGGDLEVRPPDWASTILTHLTSIERALAGSASPEARELAAQVHRVAERAPSYPQRLSFWMAEARKSRWPDRRDALRELRIDDDRVHPDDLKGWEAGTRTPTPNQLEQLAEAYGVSRALFDDPPDTIADVIAHHRLGRLSETKRATRQPERRRRAS